MKITTPDLSAGQEVTATSPAGTVSGVVYWAGAESVCVAHPTGQRQGDMPYPVRVTAYSVFARRDVTPA